MQDDSRETAAEGPEAAAGEGGASRRQGRRRRTADAIRRAAIDLVRRRGLDNVTVEMIAEAAGISLRSFFNHFRFKEEALIPPPLSFSPEAAEAFVAGRQPLLDDVLDLVATHLAEVAPDREEIAIGMQLADENPRLLAVRERTIARYEAAFRSLVARRLDLPEDDVRPQLIAATLSAAVRVAMQRWAAGSRGDLVDEVRAILRLLPRLFDLRGEG